MASAYRLDQLGWLQFDRLAELVLEAETGLRELQWRGDADHGRLAVSGNDVLVRGRRRALRGPVTVVVVWVRDGLGVRSRAIGLVDAIASLPIDVDEALLVVTNLEATEARQALRQQVGAAFGQVAVLGATEISASLDRHPSIRRAMPSVLGLVELTELIAPEIAAGSSLDIVRAQSLARVFWPTQAYDRALGVLGRHRFVVLTGAPEMGKTAIAQMLGLALMTDGWEAHECTSPEQVFVAFDPHRAQVFVADDAFGSTEYRPDAGERWAAGLGRLLTMLDDRHWLIWTSRPAPLKAGLGRVQRERGTERFPQPGEVLVDASALDLADKTLILFRHAKDHPSVDSVRSLLRFVSERVVEHPHFTPERIRRFVADRLDQLALPSAQDDHRPLIDAVEQELASPTEGMRTSFAALEGEHRDLLVALLDAPAGLVDERELAETVRRHHPGGLSRPPGELIDRLTDHFLRVTPLGIGWVHPSWRDLVIEELRDDPGARRRFLTACGLDGVILALSHAGGASGQRTLPLLLTDQDWDALGDRIHELLRELDQEDLADLLRVLAGAVSSAPDRRTRAEVISLASGVLESSQRRPQPATAPMPTFVLEAWFQVDAAIGGRVSPPHLTRTWIERHPGSPLPERLGRSELLRLEDWLELADLLQRHDPDTLGKLGFHRQDAGQLAEAIPALTEAATDPDLRDVAEAVLDRIARLLPELAEQTGRAILSGWRAAGREAERWWVPGDLPAPPTDELVTATPFARRDVHRVLRDL